MIKERVKHHSDNPPLVILCIHTQLGVFFWLRLFHGQQGIVHMCEFFPVYLPCIFYECYDISRSMQSLMFSVLKEKWGRWGMVVYARRLWPYLSTGALFTQNVDSLKTVTRFRSAASIIVKFTIGIRRKWAIKAYAVSMRSSSWASYQSRLTAPTQSTSILYVQTRCSYSIINIK